MLKHREWASIEGQFCLVTSFTPVATVNNGSVARASGGMPYASVQLRRKGNPEDEITGYITHKTDFLMLWAAFLERIAVPATRIEIRSGQDFRASGTLREDEEVWLAWTRKHYRRFVFFKAFLPSLQVMVCGKGAFQIYEEGPGTYSAEAWFLAWEPVIKWTPEVMDL
jgi:hypothetical protein